MSDETLNFDNLQNMENLMQEDDADSNVAEIENNDSANNENESDDIENEMEASEENNEDFEEAVITLFNKSLAAMVEKETFDNKALHEAFVKALG